MSNPSFHTSCKRDYNDKVPTVIDVKSVNPFAHSTTNATKHGTELKWGETQPPLTSTIAATENKSDDYCRLQQNEKRRIS